ncbi:MAG: beta-lactamase family protein [Flavobacterium sp.]|nr:beta-lactamase family protein [Flavobacterium sp.]
MTFKINIKLLLLFTIVTICFSCTEQRKVKKTKEQNKVGSVYRMQPFEDSLPNISEEKKKIIADSLNYLYDKEFFSNDYSGSVLVAQNGHIIYEKYSGMANFEKQEVITAQTPLHIASVSKVLTATAVLLLIDSKQLQLDQKVKTLFADFPYEDITIRMLLNHRSGIRNYSYFIEDKGVWDRHNTLQNSDLIPILAKNNIQLEFKPDSRFSYCNTNYAILALVIEKITKMDYRTAMKKLIFEPLHMKNTFVFDMTKHADTVSASYKGNYIKYPLNHLDDIYGDKNIYSTARDLLKFDMATYSPTFLNKKLLKEVFKGYSYESRGKRNYGLGIRLLEWGDDKKMFYHNGWWHGNTSAYIKLINEKATLIALSNKYTRKAYYLKLATGLFGDYPFHIRKKSDELVE